MIFMILMLVILLAGHGYVSLRVWQLLPLPVWAKIVVISLMALCLICMFVFIKLPQASLPLNFKTAVYETGTSWLMILLYLFMLFVLIDVCRLTHLLPAQYCHASWVGTGVVATVMLACFVGGNLHYRHKVRVPLTVASSKISRPMKVVMLSDLHLGYHNRKSEFLRWIELINREQPDLIVVAGDIIDLNVEPLQREQVAREFHRLNAPVVACLGNHEYISGLPQALAFYREAGITLLRDQVTRVQGITIVGRDDRSNRARKPLNQLMANVGKDEFVLLLDHQPYHLEEAQQAGVDFQFSGHTHYGQVWPLSWITDAIYEDAFGPLTKGKTQYYVSSGLGIWGGKFRIGTRSEYVVVDLTPQR